MLKKCWTSLCFLGLLVSLVGCAEKKKRSFFPSVSPDQLLTVEQMREDLKYTVDVLSQVHPQTVKGFNDTQTDTIESLREEVAKPMAAYQFYMRMNTLFCSMKDGHTHLYSLNHKENKVIAPSFVWLTDGLYVKSDGEHFKQGDKVLSIGGKTVDDLFFELETMIPSENVHWTRFEGAQCLSQQSYLEKLALVEGDCVDFKLQRNDYAVNVCTPLLTADQKQSAPRKSWVRYEIDSDYSLGIFTLDVCRINDKYKQTVEAFFREVRDNNIQHIVIDVRRNGGGNSLVVDEFLSYIDVNEYRTFGCEIRYSRASAERHGTPSRGYSRFKNNKSKKNRKKDAAYLFNGKLYILTSTETFSSGNWFAVIIKDNQLGIVVGEPTGNKPSSYGDCLSFQMPNSGFMFSCSFKKWIRPDTACNDENALYPDVPVYTTIDDIIHQRDPQLDKIRELIAEDDGIFRQDKQG